MLYLVHLVKREIRIDNDSSDKYWLHRDLLIQLPYDHDHDDTGPWGVVCTPTLHKGLIKLFPQKERNIRDFSIKKI